MPFTPCHPQARNVIVFPEPVMPLIPRRPLACNAIDPMISLSPQHHRAPRSHNATLYIFLCPFGPTKPEFHMLHCFDMLHCHIDLICYIALIFYTLLHFFCSTILLGYATLSHCFDMLHCHIALICYIVLICYTLLHCFYSAIFLSI
jgi:hypothetical protein